MLNSTNVSKTKLKKHPSHRIFFHMKFQTHKKERTENEREIVMTQEIK